MATLKHFKIVYGKGIFEFPGKKTVFIGQLPGCDIRIDNHSDYEDEMICKIDPDTNGGGWHLVRLSPHFSITVDGRNVNRVAYLDGKDTIQIGGETLKFIEVDGEQKSTTIQQVKTSARSAVIVVGLLVVILGAILGWRIYDGQREILTDTMKTHIEESVVCIRVDSLQLLHGDSVMESYEYDTPPTGSAFITTDSLLVTARHCIEPWLNMVLPYDYASLPQKTEWPIAKALLAETNNQLEGTDSWRIVAYMTVTDESNNNIMSLTSDDFTVCRDLDEIVELGDYDSPQYWRSISHRYNRKDMMLGDVASARIGRAGSLPLASDAEIRTLLDHKGVKLTFFGYPEAGVTGNRLEVKSDELRLPLEELPELPGRLFLLSHEGGLAPGFSGGPVVVRDGMGFKVVGVISVTDEHNGYRSYSLPATEVKK